MNWHEPDVIRAAPIYNSFSDAFSFDGENHRLWRNGELILLSPKAEESGFPIIENKTRLGYRITVPVHAPQKSNGNFQSPDSNGTEMVFYSNVWVFDKENENLQKHLTFSKSNTDGYRGIAYFTHGEIVYTSNEGDSFDSNLWRISPNNNERRQLTASAGSNNENPIISPDDKFLYFSYNRGGKLNIRRIDANGENPTQITSGENAINAFPQISLDGAWLYFIRNAEKSSAVWRKSLIDNKRGSENADLTGSELRDRSFLNLSVKIRTKEK